jgi:hypothetical protein
VKFSNVETLLKTFIRRMCGAIASNDVQTSLLKGNKDGPVDFEVFYQFYGLNLLPYKL